MYATRWMLVYYTAYKTNTSGSTQVPVDAWAPQQPD